VRARPANRAPAHLAPRLRLRAPPEPLPQRAARSSRARAQRPGRAARRRCALNRWDGLARDSDLIGFGAQTLGEPPLEGPQAIQDATQEVLETAETGDEEATNEALGRREAALEAENARKNWYKFGFGAGIPAIVVLLGLVRWQMRKSARANLKP